MHFVWKMILNQWPAEKAYYIWAPNQNPFCAICVKNDFESMISWWTMFYLSTKSTHNTSLSPSSSFTSGVSRSSLLSSPREFGSCKLCGKDFSIDIKPCGGPLPLPWQICRCGWQGPERERYFLWKMHSRTQHLATEEVGDIVMVGDTPTDHEKGNRYKYCFCHNGWV